MLRNKLKDAAQKSNAEKSYDVLEPYLKMIAKAEFELINAKLDADILFTSVQNRIKFLEDELTASTLLIAGFESAKLVQIDETKKALYELFLVRSDKLLQHSGKVIDDAVLKISAQYCALSSSLKSKNTK